MAYPLMQRNDYFLAIGLEAPMVHVGLTERLTKDALWQVSVYYGKETCARTFVKALHYSCRHKRG